MAAPNFWTFSNSNRTVTFTDPGSGYPGWSPGYGGNHNARSVNGRTGKRYWEFVWAVNAGNIGHEVIVGVCDSAFPRTHRVGLTNDSVGYDTAGLVLKNGAIITTIAPYVVGNVVMVAVDPSNGHTWFGVNGTWTGDPAAGTGYSVTAPVDTLYTVVGGDNVNNGPGPFVLYQGTGNFSAATQTYAAPAGFTAWDD